MAYLRERGWVGAQEAIAPPPYNCALDICDFLTLRDLLISGVIGFLIIFGRGVCPPPLDHRLWIHPWRYHSIKQKGGIKLCEMAKEGTIYEAAFEWPTYFV